MTASDKLEAVETKRLPYQIAGFLVTRTVVNTSFRMIYPFLPTIARGLGVSLEEVTRAITLRASLGLLSPVLGSLADSRGRKNAMLIGIGLFISSMLLVGLIPTYPTLLIALVLTSASKIIFDPAMYAYLGDRVPYERRGLVSGIIEFSWSGAFLLGVPAVGWLIARAGWSSPFLFIGLITIGLWLLLWRVVPKDPVHTANRPSMRQGVRIVLTSRAALASIAIGFLIASSNEVVNIVYGKWLEDSFRLQVEALGLSAAIIGISELLGEGMVAGLVDRVGKRRAVGLGLVLSSLSCLLLPVLGTSLDGAQLGLFLFYLTFEFTVVSAIPLSTELVPAARATMLAGNAAASSLGRMFGSLLGPALFAYGLGVNTAVGAAFNVVGLLALIFFIQERPPTVSEPVIAPVIQD